jgi:hypothetical protein
MPTLNNSLYVYAVLLLLTACDGRSAGIKVDLAGEPVPSSVSIDQGRCEAVSVSESNGRRNFGSSNCGGPGGNRRIEVRCSDKQLPPAVLNHYFPPGDSHYVVFNDVCSMTAKEILDENTRAKGELSIWGRSKK